ncbi:MAG: AmmeMemoRadiSam system protein B [candidate division Zixibacteria bacterium]|nr:AmmeMemoRadiSam system protein B [Candidatus Tariuqbacter arcticus]
MRSIPNLLLIVIITLSTVMPAAAADPSIQKLLDQAGIKPQGDQRGQMDIIGFASTAEQMDIVFTQCQQLAERQREILEMRYGWDDETTFIAGVCPHDDYYYAGRLYSLLLSRVRAKRVIIFGVFHKAKYFDCRDVLVFDSYQTWHAPYGPVQVSPLREEIIERLPSEDYIIDNDMQMVEHSVEAIVPFLQAYNREVEIISILVPYMAWDTLEKLAGDFADALTDICLEKGWRLGEDVCLICSADAVHYGDSGWGGKDFAPFGADALGYQMAVKRDTELAENFLCGIIKREKLKGFMDCCVDSEDMTKYLITWCGRFSIPFGLNIAVSLMNTLEGRKLEGTLLDYGTSVGEASLDMEGLGGMGVTAPNNLHHWVGYAAIGYR